MVRARDLLLHCPAPCAAIYSCAAWGRNAPKGTGSFGLSLYTGTGQCRLRAQSLPAVLDSCKELLIAGDQESKPHGTIAGYERGGLVVRAREGLGRQDSWVLFVSLPRDHRQIASQLWEESVV